MRGHIVSIAGTLLAVAASAAYADNDKTTHEAFFASGSASLDANAKGALDAAAKEAKSSPGAKVVINAHTDPSGSAPSNVALSIRRAEAARNCLIARGVDADNIILAFYGEAAPRRKSFAEDRRVSIELTNEPLFVVIDRALPEATGLTWKEPTTTAQIDGPRVTAMARR